MFKKEDVLHAAKVLNLPSRASIKQIQEIYRKLTMKYHPDRTDGKTGEQMAEITAAFDTVIKYCEHFEIPFNEDEMPKSGEEWWIHHFGDNM